jgi:hypothetical protein
MFVEEIAKRREREKERQDIDFFSEFIFLFSDWIRCIPPGPRNRGADGRIGVSAVPSIGTRNPRQQL